MACAESGLVRWHPPFQDDWVEPFPGVTECLVRITSFPSSVSPFPQKKIPVSSLNYLYWAVRFLRVMRSKLDEVITIQCADSWCFPCCSRGRPKPSSSAATLQKADTQSPAWVKEKQMSRLPERSRALGLWSASRTDLQPIFPHPGPPWPPWHPPSAVPLPPVPGQLWDPAAWVVSNLSFPHWQLSLVAESTTTPP